MISWYLLRNADGVPVYPFGHNWRPIETPNDLWCSDNLDFVTEVAKAHADKGFAVHLLTCIQSRPVESSTPEEDD